MANNIQCEVFTASTLNGLKTAVNNFFNTNPENNWNHLIGFDYGMISGEYTAMILFRTE
jgi:hypothetical protein